MAHKNVREKTVARMLDKLDHKQKKAFRDYLQCSLFNTNPTMVRMLDLMLKMLNDKKKKGPVSAESFLSGSGIRPAMLNKLSFQLRQHLNKYMALWIREQDSRSDLPFMFKAWREVGLESDLMEREYQKMKKKLQQPPIGEFDIAFLLQLEHQYAQYRAMAPRKNQVQIFDNLVQAHQEYHTIQSWKYQCATLNATRIFGKPKGENAREHRKPSPLARAYQLAYEMLDISDRAIEIGQELLAHLTECGKMIALEDRKDLYGYLLNTCIRIVGAGNRDVEDFMIRVYDELLNLGLLLHNGQMHSGHFHNIVSLKSRRGLVEETEKFIEEYQGTLQGSDHEVLVEFSLGLLEFYQGDFWTAIPRFRSILHTAAEDMFWALEARNMLWKSYFEAFDELSAIEYEEMIRLYDSFRQYVARKENLSQFHRNSYANFIRIFSRMIRIKEQFSLKDRIPLMEEIYQVIVETEPLTHKEWLLSVAKRGNHG